MPIRLAEAEQLTPRHSPSRRTVSYTHLFRQCHGSIVCKELLGLDRPEGTPRPEARTPEYYRKRPCPELARSAADILEQFLNEKVPPCDWKAP